MNIVAAEMVDEKKHSAESEEAEEEEFVKYGAVDEFYNLDKEIGKIGRAHVWTPVTL